MKTLFYIYAAVEAFHFSTNAIVKAAEGSTAWAVTNAASVAFVLALVVWFRSKMRELTGAEK